MKTEDTPHRINSALPAKLALSKELTTGTEVTAPNEDPVRVDVIELEPFVKVKKPSRSSTIYDKVE